MSLKSTEVNMRGGPGTDFSILYTYKSRFMPVKVVGEYDKWFKIVDKDDDGGWISGHLLSKTRTVITLNDVQILYSNYNREAYPIYKVKKNVIARLLKCKGDRCKVKIGKVKGWLDKNCIWGHNEDI
ncbi:MAG: SH3 domain-containing protein [Rickettsiales bacterium]|nr:SH3 domain-containing protein [Rickettsiales bacterium]